MGRCVGLFSKYSEGLEGVRIDEHVFFPADELISINDGSFSSQRHGFDSVHRNFCDLHKGIFRAPRHEIRQ